jgi:hypothetical protein
VFFGRKEGSGTFSVEPEVSSLPRMRTRTPPPLPLPPKLIP